MGGEGLQDLDEYLSETLGDDYHGVIACQNDDDGIEYHEYYLRDDIHASYTDEDRVAMAREAVMRAIEEGYLERIYQLGDRRFTVEYFDNAALLFFATSDSRSVVVGTEPEPDLDHTAIASDCHDILSP